MKSTTIAKTMSAKRHFQIRVISHKFTEEGLMLLMTTANSDPLWVTIQMANRFDSAAVSQYFRQNPNVLRNIAPNIHNRRSH